MGWVPSKVGNRHHNRWIPAPIRIMPTDKLRPMARAAAVAAPWNAVYRANRAAGPAAPRYPQLCTRAVSMRSPTSRRSPVCTGDRRPPGTVPEGVRPASPALPGDGGGRAARCYRTVQVWIRRRGTYKVDSARVSYVDLKTHESGAQMMHLSVTVRVKPSTARFFPHSSCGPSSSDGASYRSSQSHLIAISSRIDRRRETSGHAADRPPAGSS